MTNLCQKVALAGAATMAVTATMIMAKSVSAQSVTICQSLNFQIARCSIDTRGGVVLVRRFSHNPCRPEIDWVFNRGSVWVRNGCRAEFRSGSIDQRWQIFDEGICCESDCYSQPRPRRRVRYPRRIPICPY
ncbi:DUF3011 domain-containing protein [Floridanema evergladense]|uniref:DUF3011 domain-containing protein n=1 Tax=Floridaenema evergladense BLCC-F167 TaxID=3153639 RepID=A0ABV4WUF1_9CYAN